jgi:hypothetical protein
MNQEKHTNRELIRNLLLAVLLLPLPSYGLTATWQASATPGVFYRLYASKEGQAPAIVLITSNTTASFSLTAGAYSLWVTAVNTNESDPSNIFMLPPLPDRVTGVTGGTNIVVPPPTSLLVEAEAGTITSPMAVFPDATAYGFNFIRTVTANSGTAVYSLSAVSGIYALWTRIRVPNNGADSFFFSIDGGPEDTFGNEAILSPNWQWARLHGGNNSATVITLNWTTGPHTIRIRGREPGADLDAIQISTNLVTAPSP